MSLTLLNSRERVRLALSHQETDRVPIAMVCSGINKPAKDMLEEYLRRERNLTVEDYLEPIIDIVAIGPDYIGPTLSSGKDIWGVHRKSLSYGKGSYDEIDHYPLTQVKSVDELNLYQWPSPDWWDYNVIPDKIRAANANREHAIIFSSGNIFETTWYMRGFEQIFMDLMINPDIVHSIMDKVTCFFIEFSKRTLSMAEEMIDLAFTADDIAGQQGLLMSLDMWERHIKPYHIRLNKVLHEFGVKVMYHSDGTVMDAVPGLIDMGIDVLQALQFSAHGMDPVILKEKYGDKLCFEGGIDVQTTLPFGTVEDVRREVEDRIHILGRNGGYILGPSHAIQAGTPPENIVAMFDTATGFRPE